MRHLAEEGVSVELFAAQNLFYSYNDSLINKVKLRAGIAGIYKSINEKLRARILDLRPDVVWIFKGMEIMPETIGWMREKGILVVNYNPDNPFIFSGRGSGNKYVTRSIPLFDLHFTYNLEVKKKLEEQLHLRTALLPFGFELTEEVLHMASEEKEIKRVCFLGNPDSQRAVFIKALLDAGISIDLYGNDWGKFITQHPFLQSFPAVYGDDFWKVLRRYRVQLNLMRVHNEDSHNMRSFEVPGVGGIMLAPATTEHHLFFRDGEEVSLFDSVNDGIRKAKSLLELDMEAAGRMRYMARKRSLESGYTYQQRTKFALQEIRNLYAQTSHSSL